MYASGRVFGGLDKKNVRKDRDGLAVVAMKCWQSFYSVESGSTPCFPVYFYVVPTFLSSAYVE